ncbi:MAG: hypothetical protein BA864_10910 [Desulfuromonadales bacterium C00003093]|nr:MAG: hypothetical protein BA864_10910 [Desulfuromonadales bacterium C00003093]
MGSGLNHIIEYLKLQRGMDFCGYRLSTLQRRLSVRMSQVGALSSAAYWERLISDPAEPDRLIDVFGVNVSHFFRDPLVFEMIGQRLLPELIESKIEAGNREIRVWSAGCGGGEEAYSLAILLHQTLKKQQGSWRSYIFASDINGQALQQAAQAYYPREKFKDTRLTFLDEYFVPTDNGFAARPFLREMVQFSSDDLTSLERMSPAESIYGSFDLILCRNVLIYFDAELRERVFEKLYHALGCSGILVLGNAEVLPNQLAEKFKTIDVGCRIWRKASR